MVDTNNFYDLAGYVLISDYRKLVLEVLTAWPKTNDEIVNELNVSKRAIKKATNELKNVDLIYESNGEFLITEIGLKVIEGINKRKFNNDCI